MKRRVVTLAVAVAVGSVMGVGAHHSVATVYDESRTMTLEGKIGRFLDNQPHALLHLSVRGGRGRTRTWAVEFDTANKLSSSRVSQAALRLGDRITVCGNPGRDPGTYRLRMLLLRRPSDGLSLRSEQRLTRATCAW